MLISVEKKFIFVANTKAASSSVEHLLLPYSDICCLGTPKRKHIPMKQVLKRYPFLFEQPAYAPNKFFRFGVMRHPLDWIKSWYRYRKGNKVENPLDADMNFSAFWNQKDWNIIRANGHKYLQRQMFCSNQGELLMDVIIPHHRLSEMLPPIFEHLGIDAPLVQKNKSVLRDAETIDEPLHSEIMEFYARDFQLFHRLDQINAAGMKKLRKMTA